jgi:hypothetical protein
METSLQPELIAALGARATRAAAEGERTFAVPELAEVARVIAADDRASELRDEASRWSLDGARYDDLVRLSARYVQALDRALPLNATEAIYVPKAAAELEPMLALWPDVLVLPTVTRASERTLIALRAFPAHLLGVVARIEWADGRPCSPAEFFFHDLDHARFKLREDLAAEGIEIPDAYEDGSTLDPRTGRHRAIVAAAMGHTGGLWRRSGERLGLARRLHAATDALADRTLASAADLLLFEILHEKSFPLEPRILRRELARSAHREKIAAKLARRFYGARPPSPSTVSALGAASDWLLGVVA